MADVEPAEQPGRRPDRYGAPMLVRYRDRRVEQRGFGQRSCRVVDDDDVEASGVHVVAQHPKPAPLRVVPSRTTGDQRGLAPLGKLVPNGIGHHVTVLVPVYDDEPLDVLERRDRAQRPRQHRNPCHRQQHLVRACADPGAGSGRQQQHGRPGHGHGAEPARPVDGAFSCP